MYRQWVPCERNSSYNFIPIFLKLCTYFLHVLKMCMWFGYNPCINFCYFFHFANFVIFWPQILWKCIDSGYLVSATLYTISCLSLCNFAHLFFHGLKMCMWFGFNPAVNFCHFSTLLTLSFFAGATSTSPKFDLFFFCPSWIRTLVAMATFCCHRLIMGKKWKLGFTAISLQMFWQKFYRNVPWVVLYKTYLFVVTT